MWPHTALLADKVTQVRSYAISAFSSNMASESVDLVIYVKSNSFPQVFTPKDKLADWFTYYAGALELNVWMRTEVTSSQWDDASRQWTVTLTSQRNGVREERTLRPRHIILATGHAGEPHFPSDIQGIDAFRGDRLTHSSNFTEPSNDAKGKRAVIAGSCNSCHDIARDYYDHGYNVTMVQ